MADEGVDRLAAQIELAESLAERRAMRSAALAFATVRSMAVELAVPADLSQAVRRHTRILETERERYRSLLAAERTGERRFVILGDSLGLPRPDDRDGALGGAERTYPGFLREAHPDRAIESLCQRYFTSEQVLQLAIADDALGRGDDVVVHIGLNDCANRMFLERERLALNLVSDDTRERIVEFARRHRRALIEHLPSYHYVELPMFAANLDALAALMTARGARSLVLATIILPPERFWAATPGIHQNFGRYNQVIRDVARRHRSTLLDIDRLVWARLGDDVLLPDGMHLSRAGHRLFADQLGQLIG